MWAFKKGFLEKTEFELSSGGSRRVSSVGTGTWEGAGEKEAGA